MKAHHGIKQFFLVGCVLFSFFLITAPCFGSELVFSIQEGCYQKQENAQTKYLQLAEVLPKELTDSLRVEIFSPWYCVRFGATQDKAELQRVIEKRRKDLPEAIVREVSQKVERVVLGKTSNMDTPILPDGVSLIMAETTESSDKQEAAKPDSQAPSKKSAAISEQKTDSRTAEIESSDTLQGANKPPLKTTPLDDSDSVPPAADADDKKLGLETQPTIAENKTQGDKGSALSPAVITATPVVISEKHQKLDKQPKQEILTRTPATLSDKAPEKKISQDTQFKNRESKMGTDKGSVSGSARPEPKPALQKASTSAAAVELPKKQDNQKKQPKQEAKPKAPVEPPVKPPEKATAKTAVNPAEKGESTTVESGDISDWGIFAAGLVVLGLLARLVLKKNGKSIKKVRDKEPTAKIAERLAVSSVPRLSNLDERHLEQNLNQISLIQSSIISSQGDKEIKSIYVTSCFNGEGKTMAAISMAHGLAINKNNVLLIDGNPRAPKLYEVYHTPMAPGLLDKLADDGEAKNLVRQTFYPNLNILTFGKTTNGRPDLIAEDRLLNLLAAYSKEYDYIIMDGHSLTGSDTGIVATKFDSIVLVAQCEKTKWEVIKQASQKLTLMGGTILGVVLNRRKFYLPKFIYNHL